MTNGEEWNPIGLTIVAVLAMRNGTHPWADITPPPLGFELSDGSVLYASCDVEGNAPGVFFCSEPGDDDPLVITFA